MRPGRRTMSPGTSPSKGMETRAPMKGPKAKNAPCADLALKGKYEQNQACPIAKRAQEKSGQHLGTEGLGLE